MQAGLAGESPDLADIARQARDEGITRRRILHEVQAHLDLAPADARLGGVVVRHGCDGAVSVQDGGDDREGHTGEIPGGIEPACASPVDQGPEPPRACIDEHIRRVHVAMAEGTRDIGQGVRREPVEERAEPACVVLRERAARTEIIHPGAGIELRRLTEGPERERNLIRCPDRMDDRELAANRFPYRSVSRRMAGDAVERFGMRDPAKDGDGHGKNASRVVEGHQLRGLQAHRPDERGDGHLNRDRLDRRLGVEGDLDDNVAAGEDLARRAGPRRGEAGRRREPVPAGDRDELRVSDRADLIDHVCGDSDGSPESGSIS